jgi:hypothetical protein
VRSLENHRDRDDICPLSISFTFTFSTAFTQWYLSPLKRLHPEQYVSIPSALVTSHSTRVPVATRMIPKDSIKDAERD